MFTNRSSNRPWLRPASLTLVLLGSSGFDPVLVAAQPVTERPAQRPQDTSPAPDNADRPQLLEDDEQRGLDPTLAQHLKTGRAPGLLTFPGVTPDWAYTSPSVHPKPSKSVRLTRASGTSQAGAVVTSRGMMLMTGPHQSLQSVDPNGNLTWTLNLPAPLAAAPVQTPSGDVLALTQQGELLALSRSGRLLRATQLAAPLSRHQPAPIADADGRVWVSVDRLVFELDRYGDQRSVRELPSRIAILSAIGGRPLAVTTDGSIWRWSSLGDYRAGKLNGRVDQAIATNFGVIALVSARNVNLVSLEGRVSQLASFDSVSVVSNLVWTGRDLSLVTSDGQLRRYRLEGRSVRANPPIVLRTAKSSGNQALAEPVAALGDRTGALSIASSEAVWYVAASGEVLEIPPVCSRPALLGSGPEGSLLAWCESGEIHKIQ